MHIPPYLWIHLKNFMLWQKKNKLIKLPACEEAWPGQVLTTATIQPRFKKEYSRNTFDNRIITVYSIYDS